MTQKTAKPLIFEYLDFRAYLADYLSYIRRKDPAFSFKSLVDQYGFRSRSHYIDTLNGRPLSAKYIDPYTSFCGMNKRESGYFSLLVNFDQTKDPVKRAVIFKQMQKANSRLKTLKLEAEAFEYFGEWCHPVLLSIIDLDPTIKDHRKIAERFRYKISSVKIRSGLKTLQELGFISWDNTANRWAFHNRHLRCTDKTRASALVPFHKQMLNLGIEAYDKDFFDQTFSTLTLSVSEKTRTKIDAMIAELRAKIVDCAKEETEPEEVVQVNLQSFRLSAPARRNRSKKEKQ